jgi:hypothetical protein
VKKTWGILCISHRGPKSSECALPHGTESHETVAEGAWIRLGSYCLANSAANQAAILTTALSGLCDKLSRLWKFPIAICACGNELPARALLYPIALGSRIQVRRPT